MSMEDRLRGYLAEKAETLDVTAGMTVAAPRPAQRRRIPAVVFAAAAALLVVGLPLIVLSLGSDRTNEPETVAATTTAATTDTSPSTAIERFNTITGTDVASDPQGILITSLPAPDATSVPEVVEQSLRPATSDDMALGESAWERLGEADRSTPLLLTAVNQESGAYTVQWVTAGAGDIPDSLCIAIITSDETVAPFCTAAFGVSGTALPVSGPTDGAFHIASNGLPLNTSYVLLTSEQAEAALQKPVSGTVLFAVGDGEYSMAAYDSAGTELGRWRAVVGRPEGPAVAAQWCSQQQPSAPSGAGLAFYAQCAPIPHVPYPVYREGVEISDLEDVLGELLAGTTSQENSARVYTGFDSIEAASRATVVADVDGEGVAHVEFLLDGSPWVPDTGSWSSDQLNSLLDPIYATVFAEPTITGLDMSGLCFEQVACDRIVTRTEWQTLLFLNGGVLTHDGCTPELAWVNPGRCTVGGVMNSAELLATVGNLPSWDTLNLRAGPGTEFVVLAELPLESQVNVGRAATTSFDGGTWRVVDAGSAGVGWVFDSYLDIEQSALPAPANLAVVSVDAVTFEFTWDEVPGAVAYVLQLEGRDVARSMDTRFATALEVGGVYELTVSAVDADGRLSAPSQSVTAIPEETS